MRGPALATRFCGIGAKGSSLLRQPALLIQTEGWMSTYRIAFLTLGACVFTAQAQQPAATDAPAATTQRRATEQTNKAAEKMQDLKQGAGKARPYSKTPMTGDFPPYRPRKPRPY